MLKIDVSKFDLKKARSILPQSHLNELQENVREARAKLLEAGGLQREVSETVLNSREYTDEDTGERITSRCLDFAMNDESFAEYLLLCQAEYARRGIDNPVDRVYTHSFSEAVRQAEDTLTDACAAICPKELQAHIPDMKRLLHIRTKVVAICMQLCLE